VSSDNPGASWRTRGCRTWAGLVTTMLQPVPVHCRMRAWGCRWSVLGWSDRAGVAETTAARPVDLARPSGKPPWAGSRGRGDRWLAGWRAAVAAGTAMIDHGLSAPGAVVPAQPGPEPGPVPARPEGDVMPAKIETAHGQRRRVQQEAVPRTESAATGTAVTATTPSNALAHDLDPLLGGNPLYVYGRGGTRVHLNLHPVREHSRSIAKAWSSGAPRAAIGRPCQPHPTMTAKRPRRTCRPAAASAAIGRPSHIAPNGYLRICRRSALLTNCDPIPGLAPHETPSLCSSPTVPKRAARGIYWRAPRRSVVQPMPRSNLPACRTGLSVAWDTDAARSGRACAP